MEMFLEMFPENLATNTCLACVADDSRVEGNMDIWWSQLSI
jgi:hypothetical protein